MDTEQENNDDPNEYINQLTLNFLISKTQLNKLNKLKQKELTANYIEFKKIEKWDGQLPTTMAGNSGSLINIK